jgi:outer membrane protein assembly factor BamD
VGAMNHIGKLFSVALLFVLVSCGSVSERESFGQQSELDMERIAKSYLDGKSYSLAAEYYSVLNKTYPYAKDNERNRINGLYSAFYASEYELAITESNRFQQLHPHSKYIDWVMFVDAYAQFKLNRKWTQDYLGSDRAMADTTNLELSYQKAEKLIEYYPKSKYAIAASEIQHKINAILAKEALDVANYYFNKEAYIAVINRAETILKKYPKSCYVKPAISLLKNSYEKLGLTSWANDMNLLQKVNNFK